MLWQAVPAEINNRKISHLKKQALKKTFSKLPLKLEKI